ncbi:AMP-binding protein [Brachybacterium hainanense]|uniref:AMP-binding protein n=1 Tax=Brachybacterium hainanense TaxID=1541174 RepID=A0ABV6RAT6_9MICO
MRGLAPARALALRARLTPRAVVLIDEEGPLTAADLLDHARTRASEDPTVALSPAPLREILARICTPGAEAVILRSSGTTGAPVPHPRTAPSLAQLRTGLDLARRLGMRPGRTLACAAPGEHGHGLATALGALVLGMRLVDITRVSPSGAHALLSRTRPDLISGVPVHLLDLARSGPLPIEVAVSGSDVLREAARAELRRAGIGRIHDVYGATETGSVSVDGTPLRGVRVRAADGLLHVRSPFTGGREIVTDRGLIDEHGRVQVLGRADGRLVTGGMMHDPSEVAELLAELPGIAAADIDVVADARFGSRTRARVRLAAGAALAGTGAPGLAQMLRDRVRSSLGPAAVPREVVLEAGDEEISSPDARPGPR